MEVIQDGISAKIRSSIRGDNAISSAPQVAISSMRT
jgi:hypothetical protein